jgi:hypothetical protein
MIVFQSLLTGVAELPFLNQKSDLAKTLAGGSNERSECQFLCCSGVGQGEGELSHRGRQSALISFLNSVSRGRLPLDPFGAIRAYSNLFGVIRAPLPPTRHCDSTQINTLRKRTKPKAKRFKPMQGKKLFKNSSCHFATL